ncbi:GNAT family N-acetyltransferase [Thermomonospora cellulosilytica]|uniref:Ribosomal protein S18 acetylase RimI-like enzyme n=1 Tax=Thermomonospora cellulosilytica TaxID=1411118 RepID=A0A7W3R9J3_9ACTN|nr:GNAT family N-acetyltransferase [Thermomonospora cellulosilytica]MBA9004831.1 ribosomal protein S18 acetylase RimI-like enzyme [Thermomonospora cellulosilytica]
MEIRLAVPADDAPLEELRAVLDEESTFMLMEPGERAVPDEERPRLSYRVVAVEGGWPVGFVSVSVMPYARVRHRGHVVMGVRASHTGRGVGRALLEAAVAEARSRGLTRLELTVMTHNRRALALYTRCGFQVEGLRRASAIVRGDTVDEYYMGLLL